jgi:hypothetical protein
VEIVYKFSADAVYYRATMDRYYRQRPLPLRLSSQYGIVSLVAFGLFLMAQDSLSPAVVVASGIIAIAVMLGLVALTKWGILQRFKGRAEFGTEATVTVSEDGISATGLHIQGKWAWPAYPRAVRYSDGILLLRAGVIRWLPDASIQVGSAESATALIGSKSALRSIA